MGRRRPSPAGGGPGEGDRLRRAGIRPTKALGQHFLFNPRLLDFVIDGAAVGPGDLVLEVGPGTGALTRRLLARGADVVAVELDRALCRLLREELGGETRFRLIEGDAMAGKQTLNGELLETITGAPGGFKVVANLPFGSATPLLLALLEEGEALEVAVVTVQLEVADRFAAPTGGKSYGVVSVLAQTLACVEKLKRIGRLSFWPPPKVDAAVVKLVPRRGDRPPRELYRVLQDLVQWSFRERRKQLRPRFVHRWPGVAAGAEESIPAGGRPEVLAPATYLELACRLLRAGGAALPGTEPGRA